VRYGYRRVHIQLRREGWSHGQNKTRRIYRELGLQLRNKTPKRRVKPKLREDRREPRFSSRGANVVEVLERVGREVGWPSTIRVDLGSEFVSRDLDLWAYQRRVTRDFSRPGKPTDNAFIEAFNSRFRIEC
jgi:putative transposase